MKVVINDSKSGNTFQRELDATKSVQLVGKKIGDLVEGGFVGLPGYELKITGGSDTDGAPMRFDVPSSRRLNIVISKGPGVKHLKHGMKLKKRVTGNAISNRTAQLNTKIEKYGEKPLADLGFVPKPKEEKKAEAAKA
ncbi:MAG: 30S ribosomal protein S6e [Candidatus Micrarchaeota archaeon]